ncbi:hypothetical protein [Oceanospirillum maris]|jgi:hypothetical protein|uniref:hypothetical protein n=1 Tax=Oceanospirillum maris TaxID=64977 RepID=UPI0004139D1B|nr:hypothetical protein [Oceanospirillum maris]
MPENTLPRVKAITASGEIINLTDIVELQLEWDEGLPASLLLSPEHLTGPSLTLEVGSAEDDNDSLTEYGVIALRPGASNILDISIETEAVHLESYSKEECNH